jgi:molybdopterin-guanine dinucleotide biosynthesis protein A
MNYVFLGRNRRLAIDPGSVKQTLTSDTVPVNVYQLSYVSRPALILDLSFISGLPSHSMNAADICAVILAGGQSRRMGFNKALLDFGGRPLIQVLAERVLPITNQIVISSNDCSCYKFLNFPVIPDHYQGQGPLAGLHAAMLSNVRSLYIVLACDLPNLQAPLLRNLVSFVQGFDAAIPRTNDGLAHPLCAVYRRTCLPAITNALQHGANKVIETFLDDTLSIRWIGPREGHFREADLANINTPEDLQNLKNIPL